MRNNLYASVSGTVGGEAVENEFRGLDGVVLFVVKGVPEGAMANTLIQGHLPPSVVAGLLKALRETMGPAGFTAALTRSLTGHGLHKVYDRGAES